MLHPIESVILAAGESTRMGSPKALLEIGGKTFLRRIIDLHLGFSLPVTVVLGVHRPEIEARVDLDEVKVISNPDPKRGQLSSLQTALSQMARPSAILVHPVDHPLVQAATIGEMLTLWEKWPDSIVIPACAGRRGHPVIFGAPFFEELLHAPLSEGARWVVQRNSAEVRLHTVEDRGVLKNIDTPEQYRDAVRRESQ